MVESERAQLAALHAERAANGDAVRAGEQVEATQDTVLFALSGTYGHGVLVVTDTAFDQFDAEFAGLGAVTGYGGSVVAQGLAGFGNSAGVYGRGAAAGVVGETDAGYGVHGAARGSGGFGVYGEAVGGTSHGVVGLGTFGADGVVGGGNTQGNGVVGVTSGDAKAGVRAEHAALGAGIYATSAGGRGGVFHTGGAAQLQLQPGARSSHPTSGKRGDLYADKTGRLWFCKDGGSTATWHQLA